MYTHWVKISIFAEKGMGSRNFSKKKKRKLLYNTTAISTVT